VFSVRPLDTPRCARHSGRTEDVSNLFSDLIRPSLAYDPATNSLYIHLSNNPAADSDEVADGVVLDFGADGALVGIDVQHASHKTDMAHLSVSQMPLHQLEAA